MLDQRQRIVRILGLLILLMAAWLLWSGIYKPILLGLGAFSCILSVYIAHRVGFFENVSGLHIIPKLSGYWAALMVEIIKSSFEVAMIVLHPKLPISPTVVEIEAGPIGPIGQAILGNAITLSPGTLTLDVHAGKLRIHCLTAKGAQEILAGGANRRAAALTSS